LPRIKKGEAGKTYSDDSESYKGSYEFKIQPCWGFRKRNALTGGSVAAEAGRSGSQAAVIKGGRLLRRKEHNIEHAFPQPLARGHVRFYVRRGPAGWNKKRPQTVLRVTFYGAGRKEAEALEV